VSNFFIGSSCVVSSTNISSTTMLDRGAKQIPRR
jgi:hypothetical protein